MSWGPWQIAIVLLVVILLFGAKRLPEIARSLGRSASEFRRGQREGDMPDPPLVQDDRQSKT
ncbi:MAG: twin-arginine translocase TatA/TatE family subunit [Kiritimatiellae bacterium]|nr:twin-arginine translocase TatA/TatE family subunit [Kiritimatiellia bacterium]